MKVLMAPVNIAGQPILAVRELRRQGVDASLLQYSLGKGHKFEYEADRVVDLDGRHRLEAQVEALREALDEGYDIFHFWMAPLFTAPGFGGLHGLDLPFIKLRGRRIVYRGTGFDLRTRRLHDEVNPYSPFRYGYEGVADEETQAAYLAYLREYVDAFVVQDPEMLEHMPGARVIPRGIDLEEWVEVGVDSSRQPLVVHAPSRGEVKGTRFVQRAVEELREEGLKFEFQLIENLPHTQAIELYKRADIVVDQLLLGWYGVVTVEALALGKPVLTYVRDDLSRAFRPEIPIYNANPDTVTDRLRDLITDLDLRRSLASQARGFVEEVHDIRTVAQKLRALYEEVLDAPQRLPDSHADLDYFLTRAKALEAREERIDLARKARRLDVLEKRYREIHEENVELRKKVRRLDAVERRFDDFVAEINALRYKAGQWDSLQEELPTLRYKARHRDELFEEVKRLRNEVRQSGE